MYTSISNTLSEQSGDLGKLEGWVSGRVVVSCKDRSNLGFYSVGQDVSAHCVTSLGWLLCVLGRCQSSRTRRFSYARAVNFHEQSTYLPRVHLYRFSLTDFAYL